MHVNPLLQVRTKTFTVAELVCKDFYLIALDTLQLQANSFIKLKRLANLKRFGVSYRDLLISFYSCNYKTINYPSFFGERKKQDLKSI